MAFRASRAVGCAWTPDPAVVSGASPIAMGRFDSLRRGWTITGAASQPASSMCSRVAAERPERSEGSNQSSADANA